MVNEIKNKRQLKRLCILPYDLTIDEPSPESVRHVIEFAKKTGDYLSLSSADIKVIALTYQLEKELVGIAHLRTEPVVSKVIASREKPAELIDSKPLAGFYLPPNKEQLDLKEKLNEGLNELTESTKVADEDIEDGTDDIDLELKKQIENLSIDNQSEESGEVDKVLVQIEKSNETQEEESDGTETEGLYTLKIFIYVKINFCDLESSEDDDPDSWITPNNLLAVKSSYGKESATSESVRVACMSTDYAIQNVLKQINLNIAALDGKIIKQMRTYILRCYACYKTTSIMTKIFCPKCGNKTLKRVAVSLDENGQQVVS